MEVRIGVSTYLQVGRPENQGVGAGIDGRDGGSHQFAQIIMSLYDVVVQPGFRDSDLFR